MKKNDVIKYFGGVLKTALAIRVKHSAVSQWGEDIPVRRALEIEKLTKGKLKA